MGVVIVKGEGAVLGVNLGRPIVTNGAFATRSSQITLRTCLLTYSLSKVLLSYLLSSLRQRVTNSVDVQWCMRLCSCLEAKGLHIEHKAIQYMLLLMTTLSIPDISAKRFNF